MPRFIQPLLLLLARLTDRQLAGAVQYLKTENAILRSRLPKRITVSPRERRRLVQWGRDLGPAINELITIVSPRTFARWVNGERLGATSASHSAGRPRTAEDVRDLVLRLARDNAWDSVFSANSRSSAWPPSAGRRSSTS